MAALRWFWELRTHLRDGYDWAAKLLTLESDEVAISVRSQAYQAAGGLGERYDYQSAQRYAERGLVLAREAGDPQQIAWALSTLGFYGEVHNPDRAIPHLEESLALSRASGDGFCLNHSLRRLAIAQVNRGDFDRGLALAEAALVLARAAQDQNATAWSLFILGRVAARHRRDYERAQALLEEGLALSPAIHDQGHLFYTLYGLGQVALGQHDADRAERYFRQAVAVIHEVGFNIMKTGGRFVSDAGWLASLRGDWERAVILLGAGSADFGGDAASDYEPVTAEVRAQLDPDVFAAAWAKGQAMPIEAAIALALQSLSPPQRNKSVPSPGTDQPLLDPLSERELEVLHLLAAGHSNREIAKKLIFSLGTVKWYVHQIYSKLGVNSRTQAVAEAQKLHLL